MTRAGFDQDSFSSPSGQQLCCGVRRVDESTLTAPCPAKLNVFLEVLGKRNDGYHELETVMLRTSLCDQLSIRKTSGTGLELRFSDSTPEHLRRGVPLDQSNLILRAAALVQNAIGSRCGAEFVLHKRIPPESGLAGGSSNAATALLLCCRFWNAPLTDHELHMMAASLGSDINFLLSGYSAGLCRGRGERVEEIVPGHNLHFVALRPKKGNSTAEVFQATKIPMVTRSSDLLIEKLRQADRNAFSGLMFNRLTEAGRKVNDEMDLLMRRLESLFRQPVHMSGSGSTLFLAASTMAEAQRMQTVIRERLRCSAWLLVVPRKKTDYCPTA